MQRNKTQNHYIWIKTNKGYEEDMKIEIDRLDIHTHLPVGLVERVDRFVLQGLYSSRTEFISDCIRRRLEELEREEGTEPSSRHSLRSPARVHHQELGGRQ